MLGKWIEESAQAVEELSVAEVSDLSPAELRVLQFLPGHLSYPQIAAETFVSPNTVKTQAQSIYRKLGASSRREAVELAQKAGRLPEPFRAGVGISTITRFGRCGPGGQDLRWEQLLLRGQLHRSG